MTKPGNDPANDADEDDTRAVTDKPLHLEAAEDEADDRTRSGGDSANVGSPTADAGSVETAVREAGGHVVGLDEDGRVELEGPNSA